MIGPLNLHGLRHPLGPVPAALPHPSIGLPVRDPGHHQLQVIPTPGQDVLLHDSGLFAL